MRQLAWAFAFLLFAAPPAAARMDTPAPDMSAFAPVSAIPQPAAVAPGAEATVAAVGSGLTYARADHVHPRITRATIVTTASDGSFSGTWSLALTGAAVVIPVPISSSSVPPNCWITATPTTTTFQGQCTVAQSTLLNLSIVTTGLTLKSYAASPGGLSVEVLAIPVTQ